MTAVRAGIRRHRRAGWLAAVVAAVVAVMVAGPAWAHGGDEAGNTARQDVLQAIAYIVNTPGNMDAALDKVKDAQAAKDTTGVNLALVRQAQAVVAANQMMSAKALLERSIGARLDLSGTDVRPILQVPAGATSVALATGEESGTQVVTDELAGRAGLTGLDITLLVLAALMATGGVLLSIKYRPAHSVRALRHGPGRPERA